MYREYNALKDDVFEIESVRRVAEQVARGVDMPELKYKVTERTFDR